MSYQIQLLLAMLLTTFSEVYRFLHIPTQLRVLQTSPLWLHSGSLDCRYKKTGDQLLIPVTHNSKHVCQVSPACEYLSIIFNLPSHDRDQQQSHCGWGKIFHWAASMKHKYPLFQLLAGIWCTDRVIIFFVDLLT